MLSLREQHWRPSSRPLQHWRQEVVLAKPGKHRTYPGDDLSSGSLVLARDHWSGVLFQGLRRGTASDPQGNGDVGRELLRVVLATTREVGTQTDPCGSALCPGCWVPGVLGLHGLRG